VEQHRSSQRYEPVPPDFEVRLVAAMRKVADQHPRWGYRRVHAVLRNQGWEVNLKRVERLWRQHQLKVPPRRQKASGQKALGSDAYALWSLPSGGPGDIWSYDFMSLRTAKGTKLRVLNVIDEYTRVCVGFHVGYSIGAESVRTQLARLFAEHGVPRMIRSDNGREFIATGLLEWLRGQGVNPIQVAKASPQQNGFIERFNGSMRDELLNREYFHSPTEAKVVIGAWVRHYNEFRPHSGIGMRTPAAYAAYCAAQAATSEGVATERGECG
jgi:transposase InsO family protein